MHVHLIGFKLAMNNTVNNVKKFANNISVSCLELKSNKLAIANKTKKLESNNGHFFFRFITRQPIRYNLDYLYNQKQSMNILELT